MLDLEYINISLKQLFARFQQHPVYHYALDPLQSFEMQNGYKFILTGNIICSYECFFITR